jgi:lactate dehydrogenase-like 2-hydroxyacid dehydrogenase
MSGYRHTQAEFLVIAAPHTDMTDHLIGATELVLLPQGAALINIDRGAVVDELALFGAIGWGLAV